MSTLDKKIIQLQKVIQDSIPEAGLIALNTMLGAYTKRIFEFGLDSNNLKIGSYSTKPMLTGSKNFRTKTDANKFFSSIKKTSKKGKKDPSILQTQWVTVKTPTGLKRLAVIPGGYKEFRALNQLQNQFVDLNFTGELFFSVVVGRINDTEAIGFNNAEQAAKAKHLEEHFKTLIFKPTEAEIELAKKAVADFLRGRVKKLFESW